MTLAEALARATQLPPEKQAEIADFVEFLLARTKAETEEKRMGASAQLILVGSDILIDASRQRAKDLKRLAQAWLIT